MVDILVRSAFLPDATTFMDAQTCYHLIIMWQALFVPKILMSTLVAASLQFFS